MLHLRTAVGAECGVVFHVPVAERLLLHDRQESESEKTIIKNVSPLIF